jgi:hypothetical protein
LFFSIKLFFLIEGEVIKVDGKVLRKYTLSDSYKWLTLNEVIEKVDNIAKGLVKFGVKKGDKVIIFADTRLEWLVCSLALMKINATLTTLFSNLGNFFNLRILLFNCILMNITNRKFWSHLWFESNLSQNNYNNFRFIAKAKVSH